MCCCVTEGEEKVNVSSILLCTWNCSCQAQEAEGGISRKRGACELRPQLPWWGTCRERKLTSSSVLEAKLTGLLLDSSCQAQTHPHCPPAIQVVCLCAFSDIPKVLSSQPLVGCSWEIEKAMCIADRHPRRLHILVWPILPPENSGSLSASWDPGSLIESGEWVGYKGVQSFLPAYSASHGTCGVLHALGPEQGSWNM